MSNLCIKRLDENCFLNSVVKSNVSRIFEFFAKLNKIKYNILISFKLLIFLILSCNNIDTIPFSYIHADTCHRTICHFR